MSDQEHWWQTVGQYAAEPPAWTRLYEPNSKRKPTMGLKISDFSDSKYLRREDLGDDGEEHDVTIVKVTKANVARDDEDPKYKAVIQFREFPKPMIANFTNLQRIAAKYGEDTELWQGKPLKVFFDPDVMFGKERKGGLRVRAPSVKARRQMNEDDVNVALDAARGGDDSIPF